ncbi:MAG: hypothetical protein ACI9LZ_004049 [Glaciecola sp.]
MLGANGPELPFATSLICCSAARHCGLSPQPRNQEIGEFTVCGLSGLLQMQLLLTQHLLALAAQRSLRCGEFFHTRRSDVIGWAASSLLFRCDPLQQSRRGQCSLLPVQEPMQC